MVVCIDCRMILSSGIGRYIRDILKILEKEYLFNKIYCLIHKSDLKKLNLNSEIEIILMNSKVFSIFEQFELSYKIPKCDVFWSPQYNIPILPISSKIRLVTIHDVYQLAYFKKLSILEKIYVKLMINLSVTLSDKIITVSEFSKLEILKYSYASSEKIKVLYNGLSSSFSENNSKIKINKEKYFLYVGNIKPHKNLKNLLKAFKEYLKIDKSYKLYIVGQKKGFLTGEENIEEEIKGFEEFVFFTGFVSDNELNNYYSNATLFIFPSLYEGFGYPILEAMSFDIKVIASNAASIPEVGGNTILYFNPNNINDIKEKMLTSLKKEKLNYGNQLSKFSMKNMRNNYINFLKGLSNDTSNK